MVVALVLVAAAFSLVSVHKGVSAFEGAVVGFLANAWALSKSAKATTDPKDALGGFYRGQFGKFLIIIVLTVAVAKLTAPNWFAFIIGLMTLMLSYWVVFFVVATRKL